MMSHVNGLVHDLRLALRGFARRPGFFSVAVSSLALALGTSAAVSSLVDALWWRPFGVASPETLVALRSVTGSVSAGEGESRDVSWPDYEDFRRMLSSYRGLAAAADYTFTLRTGGASERARGALVSWDYFDALGVAPLAGRFFHEAEERRPSFVVVLSARRARRAFGRPERALGSVLHVNGHALTVVGVAAPGFLGTEIGAENDLWAPLSLVGTLWPRSLEFFERRDVPGVRLLGRLAPGVDIDGAEAELDRAATDLARAFPDTNEGTAAELLPFSETRLAGRAGAGSYLVLLIFASLLLLLIAATNVAGLRLVDLANRAGEIAVRRALGANGFRIARQFLVENVLLYAVAFALGVGLAELIVVHLAKLRLFAMDLADVGLALDARVLTVAGGVALASALGFGLAPAWLARSTPMPGRGVVAFGRRSTRAQAGFVVVQVALSSALLFGTGLLLRTLSHVYAVDPGFRLENVLFASVDLQSVELRYDDARAQGFYRDVKERVEALPGVRSAAWSADIPFERMTIRTLFVPEEEHVEGSEPKWRDADADVVTPGYFRTMGVALLRGRDFTPGDDEDAPGVVIVNETMAATLWPGKDPLGERLRVFGRKGVHHEVYEVVGVARDVKYRTLWEEPRPYVYFPLAQRFFQYMNLQVYTSSPPLSVLPAVRDIVRSIDRDLPLYDARPLSEERNILLARQRSLGALFGFSGAIAWILTTLGTYAAAAGMVVRRSRELGVRMALGATRERIVELVLGRGLRPVLAGLGLGASFFFVVARALAHLLVGTAAADGVSVAAAIGLLAATGALASYGAARRAARLDPAETLRLE